MTDPSGSPNVGVIGGGQLARMMHQAGIGLGIGFHLLADTLDDSAAQVVRDVSVGDYHDLAVLRAFARGLDVVTFDHEHVPGEHLHVLEEGGVAVRPGPEALVYAQDKLLMRTRLSAEGIPCPRWRPVGSAEDVRELAEDAGWPVVLKAVRGGYDGRGVWVARGPDEAAAHVANAEARGVGLIAEELVPYTRELAVLVARSPMGQAAVYPVVETVQQDGICREVYAPAPGLPDEVAALAQTTALRIAGALGVTGLLAVEMFEVPGGVLVNELAMRPHNSGHWTIDGARTSQFEQHLRAVLDLPLGSPIPTAPVTVMVNVLGGAIPDMYSGFLHCMARDPGLRIHMYGKTVKPGRKVGHVTALGEDFEHVRERARHAAAYLRGDIDG